MHSLPGNQTHDLGITQLFELAATNNTILNSILATKQIHKLVEIRLDLGALNYS